MRAGRGTVLWGIRLRAAALAVSLFGMLAVLGVSPSSAFAEEETHVFDPVLSLTGGCGTTTLDPVPDPGCPGSHAPQALSSPQRVATDSGGGIYVLSGDFEEERMDIFDSGGHWVDAATKEALIEELEEGFGELAELDQSFFEDIKLDSAGNLYVSARVVTNMGETFDLVIRYTPSASPPVQGATYNAPFIVFKEHGPHIRLAIDSLDRVYLVFPGKIDVYKSSSEGNGLLRTVGSGVLSEAKSAAIGSGPDFDIYVSALKPGIEGPSETEPFASEVYVFSGETGLLKEEIDGSEAPNCALTSEGEKCGFKSPQLELAIDRADNDVYVSDLGSESVYQFRSAGGGGGYEFLSRITHSFRNLERQGIAFDNGSTSPNQGYFYVTSQTAGVGHIYAFKPKPDIGPPVVSGQSVSGLSRSEAVLEAEVFSAGATTKYHFEYVAEATYLEDIEENGVGHGFEHASRSPEPDASLPAGSEATVVSAPLSGLLPGVRYRFRLTASNCEPSEPARPCDTVGEGSPGGEGGDVLFATFPAQSFPSSCPNEALRVGFSAALPDCRAYELVTPPDTNGLAVAAFSIGGTSTAWSAPLVSANGESLLFVSSGGSLPGYNGSGALNADGYRSRRDAASGWHTEAAGPSGVQSQGPKPGSNSPDGDYWAWETFPHDEGSLGPGAAYVRGPDQSFDLVGQGSLGNDPAARPRWISAGATHIVFTSATKLEEGAPSSGIAAVYDRSPGGPTHVVSLLPGDVTPEADASYQGASADGRVVAFRSGDALYVRIDNARTLVVTSGASTFAGLSQDGSRLFYLQGGDIFSFKTLGEGETTEIGSGGESTLVNVSADGSGVYFVSPGQLDGSAGEAGKDNLYAWDEQTEAISFIAVLDPGDVTGEELPGGKAVGGLGLWASHAVSPSQDQFRGRSSDPSRSTPNGGVIVFESRADLTAYGSDGHREIYRYDAAAGSLSCVSCDPTLAPPSGDAKLVQLFEEGGILDPLAELANVSSDGKRVFFESLAALVPADVNGARDVYEWRAGGVDACADAAGCLALISSGQSAHDSNLFAITPDGHDVFIRTTDTLTASDWDSTPSIYDARVGGGFDEILQTPCEGDACRPQSSAPSLASPGSAAFHRHGKPPRPYLCRKGKRKSRHAGGVRCIKKGKRQKRKPEHHPHPGGRR